MARTLLQQQPTTQEQKFELMQETYVASHKLGNQVQYLRIELTKFLRKQKQRTLSGPLSFVLKKQMDKKTDAYLLENTTTEGKKAKTNVCRRLFPDTEQDTATARNPNCVIG